MPCASDRIQCLAFLHRHPLERGIAFACPKIVFQCGSCLPIVLPHRNAFPAGVRRMSTRLLLFCGAE
jgi:hypothetical protein